MDRCVGALVVRLRRSGLCVRCRRERAVLWTDAGSDGSGEAAGPYCGSGCLAGCEPGAVSRETTGDGIAGPDEIFGLLGRMSAGSDQLGSSAEREFARICQPFVTMCGATFATASGPAAVAKEISGGGGGVRAMQILIASGETEYCRPMFYLAVDWQSRRAVLAVRPTWSTSDIFTDMTCDQIGVYAGLPCFSGNIHEGFLSSARRVIEIVLPTVKWLRQAGIALVVTGHSLGAGVVSVVALALNCGIFLREDAHAHVRIPGTGAEPSLTDDMAYLARPDVAGSCPADAPCGCVCGVVFGCPPCMTPGISLLTSVFLISVRNRGDAVCDLCDVSGVHLFLAAMSGFTMQPEAAAAAAAAIHEQFSISGMARRPVDFFPNLFRALLLEIDPRAPRRPDHVARTPPGAVFHIAGPHQNPLLLFGATKPLGTLLDVLTNATAEPDDESMTIPARVSIRRLWPEHTVRFRDTPIDRDSLSLFACFEHSIAAYSASLALFLHPPD